MKSRLDVDDEQRRPFPNHNNRRSAIGAALHPWPADYRLGRFGQLASGMTEDEILQEYPYWSRPISRQSRLIPPRLAVSAGPVEVSFSS